MRDMSQRRRLTAVGGVLIAGAACAIAFCYLRPFDGYLLRSWASELSTVRDEDVELRLEQIAALGEQSFPTLVSALHSERQIVAQTAASVLRQELAEWERRSSAETSRIVAELAHELAGHSVRPGPYSGSASIQLATRLLLWPIDRELIDGQRLVADCELIIQSAIRSQHGAAAERSAEHVNLRDHSISQMDALGPAELLTPVAGGGLPFQLLDAPPLPPRIASAVAESPPAVPTEPPPFVPVRSPRILDARSSVAADGVATQQSPTPPVVDSRQSLDLRQDIVSAPRPTPSRQDLRTMSDLEVMRKLVGDNESLVREAVDELYRRGFQPKHFRLAELLVDPNTQVRLQFVRNVPQMPGVDSRPWLLWLSHDQDPTVRKAAVIVLATSTDPALQQRVRELERDETDDEVLEVVRQILNRQRTNAIR